MKTPFKAKHAIVTLVCYFLFTIVVPTLFQMEVNPFSVYNSYAFCAAYFVVFNITLSSLLDINISEKIKLPSWRSVGLVLLLGVIFSFISVPLVHISEYYNYFVHNRVFSFKEFHFTNVEFFYHLILVCIIPPIQEEFLFRGILIDKLTKSYPEHLVIVFISICFTLIHISLYNILFLFIFSVIVSYIYIYTQSLSLAILFHFTINTSSIIMSYEQSQHPLFFTSIPYFISCLAFLIAIFFLLRVIIPMSQKQSIANNYKL